MGNESIALRLKQSLRSSNLWLVWIISWFKWPCNSCCQSCILSDLQTVRCFHASMKVTIYYSTVNARLNVLIQWWEQPYHVPCWTHMLVRRPPKQRSTKNCSQFWSILSTSCCGVELLLPDVATSFFQTSPDLTRLHETTLSAYQTVDLYICYIW